MPPELLHYMSKYGYKAIFALVFLQEVGIPNPIPNELVLLFSGYLIFSGGLNFFEVICLVIVADLLATNILYFTFYYFGAYILRHKPRWFPISENKINLLQLRISRGGKSTIFLGRLTPFIRGYTSVITGLLQISPYIFVPIAIITAITWCLAYVVSGILLGHYWDQVIQHFQLVEIIIGIVLLVLLGFFISRSLRNKYLKSKNESS